MGYRADCRFHGHYQCANPTCTKLICQGTAHLMRDAWRVCDATCARELDRIGPVTKSA